MCAIGSQEQEGTELGHVTFSPLGELAIKLFGFPVLLQSVASDMRFNEIFTEKEVKQEKKRQRVINSRYREDYIEPALYRAIME